MSKKLNRSIGVLLTALMCMSLLLTGCAGGNGKGPDPDPPSGNTEKVDYSTISGVYCAKLQMSETMSVDLYLKILSDGSFVFARDIVFESNEKGAGQLGKTADGQGAFLYSVVNGEQVDAGAYEATYQVEDGGIQFTSPIWFGSTEPKITAADGSVSYPRFVRYDLSLIHI